MRSLIIGHRGQDGQLLSDNLTQRSHNIHGVHNGDLDLRDLSAVQSLVSDQMPDEIYFLAAFHHSSEDAVKISEADLAHRSLEIHVHGLTNFLEAIRTHQPKCRLFYAGSSHVFGDPQHSPQNERTPFAPRNIYGITKAAGIEMCRYYRNQHDIHASTGILYNHESPLRKSNFVSQKIVKGAVAISKGKAQTLLLGNLSAQVDWGYAPDYVEAMRRILLLDQPNDFVIATGKTHTVRDFAERAFAEVGLDWEKHVRTNPDLLFKESSTLVGDPALLMSATGWQPSVSFEQMIHTLVKAEVDAC